MGRILGPFGVKGWVKVKPFTQAPGSLAAYPRWLVGSEGQWRELAVEGFETHARGPVARLEGCADREAALALQGLEVGVPREALGEAEEGSIYWVDLVGLEVVDESGAPLGRVEGLFESGDSSVMVVRGAAGSRERLIPFIPDFVKSVDRDASRIVVDWKPEYDA